MTNQYAFGLGRIAPALVALAMALAMAVAIATPVSAYTVYLKDGSRLIATEAPEIQDGQAIITLQNGTRTSIDASEIDTERTNQANLSDYGTALILEGDRFVEEADAEPEPEAPEDTLTSMAQRNLAARQQSASRQSRSATNLQGDGTGASGLTDLARRPYRANLDLSTEILGVFRGQGVEEVGIYEGTRRGRLLIELTTNSESAVFRGIQVAAGALSRVRGLYPADVEAFEVFMSTANRERAGEFLLLPEDATALLAEGADLPAFFIRNVRF